jgi:hypothetical protein
VGDDDVPRRLRWVSVPCSELTPAELYSFIAPLCPAHIQFEDLGDAELGAGDVVAILASEVPTALTMRPAEGKEGHAVMCWTEDRMVRLIEYEEWLRTGE